MHFTTKAVLVGAVISALSAAASGTALAHSDDGGERVVKSRAMDRDDPKDREKEQPVIIVPTCVVTQSQSQVSTIEQSNSIVTGETTDSTLTQANTATSTQANAQEGTCNFTFNLVSTQEQSSNL
ncbi:hypothetical protein ACIQ7Q_24900 [Streptomyces sp. NPDC096176]|uniref:hypothetical protein n=1 Tax=Streptomyces sp. NPDC096176 TaxID=3366079 RepID=UPI0037FBED13